jgi:DNA-binding NarL/FixJ family response regulator
MVTGERNMEPITILVAENQPLFRHILTARINKFPEYHATDSPSALDEILTKIKSLRPEIIMMGIRFPDRKAVEAITKIKQICPTTKVVVLAESNNKDQLIDVLEAGANGYLVKERVTIANIIEYIKLTTRRESTVS